MPTQVHAYACPLVPICVFLLAFAAPPAFEDAITDPDKRKKLDDAIEAAGIRIGSSSTGAALLAACKKKGKRGGTSKHRGVHRNIGSLRWAAEISVHGKNVFLGGFVSEDDAARAYDAASWRHHGT